MTLFSPVKDVTMADVEPVLYPLPVGTSPDDSPRFAGEPVWWLKIRPHGEAQAFTAGARRVFSAVSPGLPGGGPTLSAAVIEITPMPRPNAGLLGRLLGGTPVQYILINHDDLNLGGVTTPDLQISVAGGSAQVTAGEAGSWIGFVRQDRICRDQRAWVDDLDAAAGTDVDASWTVYGARVRSLVQPTVRLLDYRGRPLTGGSFTVTTGSGPAETVTLTGPTGDTGVVLTGVGQVAAVADTANTILASATTDTGALGAPVPVTLTDRVLAMLELDPWLPSRRAGVTGFPRWRTGNFVEPILDGQPYFDMLVPDLRTAENGGAVGLAGWAFVKEAFYDPTKVWSLLPQDNTTELVPLIHELKRTAQVRLLVNQFLQLSDADLDALRGDVGTALVLVFLLLWHASALNALHLDPAGWVAAGFGAAIVELLPDSTMFEAIRHFAEPSKLAVDAINANDPDTAHWSPYPATLADNPLAENPLQIAGVPITALTHVGVYHEKIALMQAAGQPPIAYLGGIDLNSDRLDTPDHRAYAPFHDVQVRLSGPAVADVVASFSERAAVAGTDSPLVLPSDPLPGTGHHIVQLGRTRFAPGPGAGHGPAFSSAPNGDDSTHQAVRAAIDAAQDYIYIEEQYFTPDNEYVDALVAAGTRTNPKIQALVITLPDQTTQPYGAERRGEIIAKLATKWGDRLLIGAPIRRYLNPTPQLFGGLGRMVLRVAIATLDDTQAVIGPAERLPAVPFWAFIESELVYIDGVVPGGAGTGPIGTQDPDEPDSPTQTWQTVNIHRAPLGEDLRWGAKPDKHDKNSCVLAVQLPGIYVHAKLMVVDDIFMSVGSSNLNRRGFEHDGEMNVFAVPEHLRRDPANPALRLRCQLWAEHFGLPVEMGLSLLADPISALPFFGRSWYRGTHWLPLQFGSSAEPPAVTLSTPSGLPALLLAVVKDIVTVAQESDIWATLVDPTTSLDPNTGPGDKGPDL